MWNPEAESALYRKLYWTILVEVPSIYFIYEWNKYIWRQIG